MKRGAIGILPLSAFLLLATALPARAQFFTGRIEVTVVDATGSVLPGASVDLSGIQAARVVTDSSGVARFLSLAPGTYAVKATLSGFEDYVNPAVPVVAGGNAQIQAVLRVGGVNEQVSVTAESPVIDAKKTGIATSVTLEELQNIPSGRDPWVVMQTVPGIIVDRVNVGGSESGQQSFYQAKGAAGTDSSWTLDGIPITDMAATGSTPTYYDFDTFQEMNVTTGGADLTSATGGVALNFVLRSGTNTPRGSARWYYEDESMQSTNISEELARNLGSPNGKGNRTDKYADYGFEVGGPIWKDRLWGWGSIGRTDVYTLTIQQGPDNTFLRNAALKIQGQPSRNTRASFTWFQGNKLKYGRAASSLRPPETTWDQDGPSDLYKGEVNVIVGNNLFLTARGSVFRSGFTFQPQGGMDPQVWYDDSGVWHGSYWDYQTDRPQEVLMGEGSYFRGAHEVKFGFSWRRATVESTSQLSGNKTWVYYVGAPDMIVYASSDWASGARAHYTSAWVGDTITLSRATINAGIRFDWQRDGLLAIGEEGVPGFEAWLPPITGPAVPGAITWNAASPRLGVSYSLDESRKTQLRGAYAMFASQLGNGTSNIVGVVQYRYVAFSGVDRNGDHVAQTGEIDFNDLQGWYGFDINDPDKLESVNRVGDYRVPKTHEIILGVDRQLGRDFGLSASFTWRRYSDFNWQPKIGVRSPMYVQAGTLTGSDLPDGSSYSAPYYAIPAANVPEEGKSGGVEYTGREGYHQRFLGLEVSATKRLSNRWMARFGFSTNDHREYFDDPATALEDPTPGPGGPKKDGGLVVIASGGSGKSNIYNLMPRYQVIANGLYQGPWGIDLGANMVLRQGFGQPWYQYPVATKDYFSRNKTVLLVNDVGRNRLPVVTSFDARVSKRFGIGRAQLTIDLDIFNVSNAGTVLGRQYNKRLTGVTGFNQILEIMNPRILRLGLRASF